jgi:hypothetical protein
MLYFAILLCLVLAYAANQGYFYWKRRKLLQRSWGDILASVQPVNIEGIAEIADCYLHPSSTQLRLEPTQMWEMVGKFEGLRALKENAEAMLDLALYAAQWNSVEGRIVGEMIRRDGVRLNRAIREIEVATLAQIGNKFAAFELQEVAVTYHLMRQRLLGLYQVAQLGLYAPLVEKV